MAQKAVQFFTIVMTALALIPVGAHFFELPNKIGLPQEPYFIVQGIYNGWALFGIVDIGAIVANLAHAIIVRRCRGAFRLALLAFLLMCGSLAIFFIWTYPTNLATANWTTVPANWSALRAQWEYSHAANAVVTFLALCSATASVITAGPEEADRGLSKSRELP
jgi:hypothetical protein